MSKSLQLAVAAWSLGAALATAQAKKDIGYGREKLQAFVDEWRERAARD